MGHSDDKTPLLLGLALEILLTSHGLSGRDLAAAARISSSTVSDYICGQGLTRERLEELAALLGLGSMDVERAVLAAWMVLPPPSVAWSPVNPTAEERRIDQKAAAMAAGEAADFVLDYLLREHRSRNRLLGLEEGRRLARELLKGSDRRGRIEREPKYRHWGVAVALCEMSEAMAPRNPHQALELAELAVHAARHVALDIPGSEGFRSRLQGWALAFVANARRVIGEDLPGAGRTWIEVWRLWTAGEDAAGLLSEGYLMDMEASLRRAQRQLPLALKLHEDALKLARPDEVGIILLNQAVTREESDDPEGALQSLDQAAMVIDGEQRPRLRWSLRFNQASSLCVLGRAREAVPYVEEARCLAERLRNEIDLIRTVWLDAKCLAGMGEKHEALLRLEQVRRGLEAYPFDYALASLDAALLYREEGRFGEIKALSNSILKIFKAQDVHREAIAAVILFQETAQQERVSTELVRRLQAFLRKARTNPKLRFDE